MFDPKTPLEMIGCLTLFFLALSIILVAVLGIIDYLETRDDVKYLLERELKRVKKSQRRKK